MLFIRLKLVICILILFNAAKAAILAGATCTATITAADVTVAK